MSEKLVIRINNLQNLEKNDSYEVIEETAIRWDRVIGVAVFALLLVIAAIVGLVTVLNSNTTDNVEPSIDVVISEQKTMSEQEVVLQQPPVQESLVQPPSIQQSELIVNETEVVNVPVVEEVVVEKVAVEEVTVENVEPIDIKSEKIARAQLTNGVSKKEPVDKLGSTIPMNEKGLIKVFLFTDMHGLKGETLYHEWYLAGKRMARVKINVRNNNVSASSSKFIDKYMMGDWKVNVVNHSGDALVSAQFIVAP